MTHTRPKNLKSLADHDAERRKVYEMLNPPNYNGIACPKCGDELHDTSGDVAGWAMLASMPPKTPVACKCGYAGYRLA